MGHYFGWMRVGGGVWGIILGGVGVSGDGWGIILGAWGWVKVGALFDNT